MPTYPALQEHQHGEKIDLTNIQYPVIEWAGRGASNEFEKMVYNSVINNAPMKVKPNANHPETYPVTQEDIEAWKVDRPDLPNIPLGVPKFIGNAVVSKHDNDRNLALMNEADGNYIGKAAAFGSAMGTSFLDLKALVAAMVTGGVGGRAATTIGKWGMTKLGASEFFGSKAANIGTQLVQSGITVGAANLGFQGSREIEEATSREILLQPTQYLKSLQNMGVAGASGFLLGLLGTASMIGIAGRKVMRFNDGSFLEMPPEGKSGVYYEPARADFTVSPEGETVAQTGVTPEGKPWTASRQGGLLNRNEFREYTPVQKAHIADSFKPWSAEADVTMTEEATGQMMNGQIPDVSIIMKQGIVDAGESFRQSLRDGKIDLEMFDSALSESHESVKLELAEAIKQSENVRESTKKLQAVENLPITDLSDLSQAGILKRAQLAQFEKSIMEQSPELVPANVRKFIEIEKDIQRLTEKAYAEQKTKPSEVKIKPELGAQDVTKEPAPLNKKVMKRIAALEKRKPNILSAKTELKSIKKEILKDVGAANYGGSEAYQRLSEIAEVWNAAKQLKENLDLQHDFELHIAELASHDFLISAMRDHINDAHEGATPADVKEYAETLQSTGIPEIKDAAAEFEPRPETDIDAYIKEYPPEQIKAITEKLGDDTYNKQLEMAAKKYKNIPKMREMIRNMTDCLMKGAE